MVCVSLLRIAIKLHQKKIPDFDFTFCTNGRYIVSRLKKCRIKILTFRIPSSANHVNHYVTLFRACRIDIYTSFLEILEKAIFSYCFIFFSRKSIDTNQTMDDDPVELPPDTLAILNEFLMNKQISKKSANFTEENFPPEDWVITISEFFE